MTKDDAYQIKTMSYYALIIYTMILRQQTITYKVLRQFIGGTISETHTKKALKELLRDKMIRRVGDQLLPELGEVLEQAVPSSSFTKFLVYLNAQLGSKYQTMPARKEAFKKIRSKYSSRDIRDAVQNWKNSDFLNGETTKWKCTLDWFLRRDNFQKILEGNYDNPEKTKTKKPSAKFRRGENTWSN